MNADGRDSIPTEKELCLLMMTTGSTAQMSGSEWLEAHKDELILDCPMGIKLTKRACRARLLKLRRKGYFSWNRNHLTEEREDKSEMKWMRAMTLRYCKKCKHGWYLLKKKNEE